MKRLRRMNAEKAKTSNNLEERAEKAVNEFAELYFDTEKELKAQYEREWIRIQAVLSGRE